MALSVWATLTRKQGLTSTLAQVLGAEWENQAQFESLVLAPPLVARSRVRIHGRGCPSVANCAQLTEIRQWDYVEPLSVKQCTRTKAKRYYEPILGRRSKARSLTSHLTTEIGGHGMNSDVDGVCYSN